MGYLDNNGLAHLWAALKTALNGKQEKLTGTPGQLVGFDAEGKAAPQAPPESGMTKAQADERYCMRGAGVIKGSLTIQWAGIGSGEASVTLTPTRSGILDLSSYVYNPDGLCGQFTTKLSGVADPASDYHAANKHYVDTQVKDVLPSGGTTGQALFKASDGGVEWGDVGGGGSSEEVYTIEETKIGTWIDGKPLYRKVVRLYMSVASGESLQQTVMSMDGVGQIVSERGSLSVLKSGVMKYYFGLPVISPQGTVLLGNTCCFCTVVSGKLVLVCSTASSSIGGDWKADLIIEYTKES